MRKMMREFETPFRRIGLVRKDHPAPEISLSKPDVSDLVEADWSEVFKKRESASDLIDEVVVNWPGVVLGWSLIVATVCLIGRGMGLL